MGKANKLEAAGLAVSAGIALGVSVLDLAGALESVAWLSSRVPVLTLIVVGLITGHLAMRQWSSSNEHDETVSGVRSILDLLDGKDTIEFDARDMAHFCRYLATRIREAHSSVDDQTWGRPSNPTMSTVEKDAFAEYRRRIREVRTGGGRHGDTIYREVMSFPNAARLERLRPLLADGYPNFHMRYYEVDHETAPPLLQFCVIDGAEVIFSLPAVRGRESVHVAVRNVKLAAIMTRHFEKVWDGAVALKEGDRIDHEALARLEDGTGVTSTPARLPGKRDATPLS